MAQKKHIICLGLGSFGKALAERLAKNGCRVTGVDRHREPVEKLKDILYEAVIADASSRDAVAQLNIAESDSVVISLGESIEPSLLAALHCKEQGARHIVVKNVTNDHAKLLQHLGVDRIVFPEKETAEALADRTTWPNMVDFLPIDPEYSFVEFSVPDSLVGQTLAEANLRKNFGVWIIGVKDTLNDKLQMIPGGEHRLNDDQMLLVVGKQDDLERLRDVK